MPIKFAPRGLREIPTKNIRDFDRFIREALLLKVETSEIDDGAVTVGKLADIATDSFLGRDDAGVGPVEVLSAAEARAILGISLEVLVTVTADYTVTNEDTVLVDDDSGGSLITINLPAASSRINSCDIKKLGSAANVVVNPFEDETIDDGLTAILTSQYESITLAPDGSNWQII